jgi:ABC-type transport system involved in multi-copper enzyme maturation permease subunit
MSESTNPTAPASDAPKSAAARLFDIRLLIGGLFTLYGIMLTVAGFFTSSSARAKASDININLWLGIGMLILGILFLIWHRVNPLKVTPPEETLEQPATGREQS